MGGHIFHMSPQHQRLAKDPVGSLPPPTCKPKKARPAVKPERPSQVCKGLSQLILWRIAHARTYSSSASHSISSRKSGCGNPATTEVVRAGYLSSGKYEP